MGLYMFILGPMSILDPMPVLGPLLILVHITVFDPNLKFESYMRILGPISSLGHAVNYLMLK